MLSVRAASYAYAEVPAVRDVTLAVERPQLIALTGPNGSGKSTLLKLIARVLTPVAGDIEFEGRSIRAWHPREYAKRVGYLPQNPDPVFPMRAIDVVVSGRAPFLGRFGTEGDRDFDAAERALATCDAAQLADRYLDEMSGGEQKRVFIARVLAGTPSLILLDEPLASLDIAHMQQVSTLLRDIVTSTGTTVLYATHDLNWASAFSDRMLVMDRGALAADAPPGELMRSDLIEQYFGFRADVVELNGRGWLVPR
jgi:iron complex transport system ATP-binding protein